MIVASLSGLALIFESWIRLIEKQQAIAFVISVIFTLYIVVVSTMVGLSVFADNKMSPNMLLLVVTFMSTLGFTFTAAIERIANAIYADIRGQ